MNLSNFAAVRSNGLIAMDLELGDELISADLANATDEVILATKNTRSIRFTVPAVPLRTRTSGGVRGVKLGPGDELIGMSIIRPKIVKEDGEEEPDKSLLVVSENGYGKLTRIDRYRVQARGGVGVKTFRATEKTGKLVASHMVFPGQDVMLISTGGIVNHVPLEELSVRSRLTRGSNIMKLGKGDSVASIACFEGIDKPHKQPKAKKPASKAKKTTKPKAKKESKSK
jgi:DNA gyrase subunit A